VGEHPLHCRRRAYDLWRCCLASLSARARAISGNATAGRKGRIAEPLGWRVASLRVRIGAAAVHQPRATPLSFLAVTLGRLGPLFSPICCGHTSALVTATDMRDWCFTTPTKSKLLLCKLLQRSRTGMRFASTGAESATLRAAVGRAGSRHRDRLRSSGAFVDINQSRRGPLARSYNVQLVRSPKFIDTHVDLRLCRPISVSSFVRA
jgi:hypothetical protein